MPSRESLMQGLPPEPEMDVMPQIRALIARADRTVFVLDDDPTGTQTVYDVPILTSWTLNDLRKELKAKTPTVYLLTNSRSLTADDAAALNREIVQNIRQASEQTARNVSIISRSDSTLRGHFPLETNILAEGYESPPAILLIPAFLEGGRYTIHDVHYVADGDQLIPAGETEFARDASFGYQASNLREWVNEKTDGHISAEDVQTLSLETTRAGDIDKITHQLESLAPESVCIINAASYRDLELATLGILRAEAEGASFLYRTAASFARVYSGLEAHPLVEPLHYYGDGQGGLIIVGSYVGKTTRQLAYLRQNDDLVSVEISVQALLDDDLRDNEIQNAIQQIETALSQDRNVVLYTSRELITGDNADSSLSIGQRVSDSLVAVIRRIGVRPRFILAKGGITSSDIATRGLGVKRAIVRGQVLPGIPVWRLGNETRFPKVDYIVFPGNVGGDDALARVVESYSKQGVR